MRIAATLLFVLVLLTATFVAASSKVGFVSVMAQTNVKTSAFIYIEPNRVTAGQKAAITMLIEPPPPEAVGRYSGLKIAVAHPDGTVETIGPFFTDAQGSAKTSYASSSLGTYTLQLFYPGETFANGTITCEGSTSIPMGLAIQSNYDIPSTIPNAKPTPGAAANENTWAKKASMHEPRGGLGVAVVKGKVYAIGGSNQSGLYPANLQGGFVGTNEEYDPITDTWTCRSPMPTPRSDFAIAVYNNKIYCLGGTVGTEKVDIVFSKFVTSAVNEVYDPATDTWETKAPLPNPGMFMQAAVLGNKIYVIDGNLNEVYDPENDSWTTKSPTPLPAEDYGPDGSNDYALFLLNNKLCIAGQFSSQFINYDLSEDTWSDGSQLPEYDFYSVAGAMTTGNMAPEELYLFLGIRGWVPSAVTLAFDPASRVWMAGDPIITNRVHPGIAVVDDQLYVIGGYAESISGRVYASALNELYTPIGYGISTFAPANANIAGFFPLEPTTTQPSIVVEAPEQNRGYDSGDVWLNFTITKPETWFVHDVAYTEGNESMTLAIGRLTRVYYVLDNGGPQSIEVEDGGLPSNFSIDVFPTRVFNFSVRLALSGGGHLVKVGFEADTYYYSGWGVSDPGLRSVEVDGLSEEVNFAVYEASQTIMIVGASAAIVATVVVVAGLLLYRRKRRREAAQA